VGESIITRDSYPKVIPGPPDLGRSRVAQQVIAEQPDRIRYSEASSDRYGGPGATVTRSGFPGDVDPVAWDFQMHARPAPRSRLGGGFRVPAPEIQTMSNTRRAEVAGLERVPEAVDILGA
jgi:hypothetical protein